MIRLKEGSTSDPRLDRIPSTPDSRDRRFTMAAVVQTRTPRSYTWPLRDYLDQGREGACVGFALAHELCAVPLRVPQTEGDARAIYYAAQFRDPWPGGEYPGADPVYGGTSVRAGVEVVRERGHYAEYRWGYTAEELALAVGNVGPVVIGINWYENMMDTDSSGFIEARGPVVGGHATLLIGYNHRSRYFVIHNSWGPDWGRYGRAKITMEDVAKLLWQEGEAVLPLRQRLR